MSIKEFDAQPKHEAFRQDLLELLGRHMLHNRPGELLAIAAQVVGQLIALQDSSRYTPAEVMALVTENIQIGNATVVEASIKAAGGRQ